MKGFWKRWWPWKRIVELEEKVQRLLAEVSALRKVHHQDLLDERTAHEETKQHLKAARDANDDREKHMRQLVRIVAARHGIK